MNSNLNQAKKHKDDEFYTRVPDIEQEIRKSGCYDGCFAGKIVLCNCNDAGKSGFRRFFREYYNTLGLRGLIITSYGDDAVAKIYDGTQTKTYPLTQNGDFRSDEGLEILRRADIVCTNPPFSLFRTFLKLTVENDRDFLIVGNTNEMLCQDIFSLYMGNKVRYGKDMVKSFQTPEGVRNFGNIGWYTNIGTPCAPAPLNLTCRYAGHEYLYPKFDNYDAIAVDRVQDIPCDYYGEMGVPGGYLLVHDPSQFELVGTSGSLAGSVMLSDGTVREHPGRFYLDGSRLYERVVIRRKGCAINNETRGTEIM